MKRMRTLNNDALVLLLVVGAGVHAYFKGWVGIFCIRVFDSRPLYRIYTLEFLQLTCI